MDWITGEEWALMGLLLFASLLLIWGMATVDPPAKPAPRHARWKPPALECAPDGPAPDTTLTGRENLPWKEYMRERSHWPPINDHDLDI